MSSPNQILPFTQVSRRGFLAAGGAGVVGLSLKSSIAARAGKNGAVIQIMLNGGASHLETFDPKPHAPREIRGPLHSIATRIPSVRFSECLPQLADRADRLVIVRSLFHEAAPIHETGCQLLQTGRLTTRHEIPLPIGMTLLEKQQGNSRFPVAMEIRRSGSTPNHYSPDRPFGQLPCPFDLHQAGVNLPDFHKVAPSIRDAYGTGEFGKRFWTAARLVESGSRYVLVNTFDEIEGHRTWDAHGDQTVGPATMFDYRDTLGPQLDRALSALLDDLQSTGLWNQTLIICAGEMGRAPRLNEQNGRDHWTQAWSGLLAGGMLEGGQVIGETDEHGESVLNDPFPLSQLPAMAMEFLGESSEKQEAT
ncbi:MAG TPA: DUF1501 domain-containing protein [Planctomicrobium sp.]|nr:DUF1501 domain-containing protein [Planctomicrobium sp.]